MIVVLVEDDFSLRAQHETYLTQHGYQVEITDEASAADLITAVVPELVILGLTKPGSDGLGLCRQIRPYVPSKIMFLATCEDDIEHVAALELGADDFIQRPISPRVLLARIRMLTRRQPDEAKPAQSDLSGNIRISNEELICGSLKLDNKRKSCELSDNAVQLTASEFDLLWLLASKADEVLSREFLVKAIRGIDYDGIDRTIDNKIVTLRKKLGDTPSLPKRIITVRSKGYLFSTERW